MQAFCMRKKVLSNSIDNDQKYMRLSQKHETASFSFIRFAIHGNRFGAYFFPLTFNIINIFNSIGYFG